MGFLRESQHRPAVNQWQIHLKGAPLTMRDDSWFNSKESIVSAAQHRCIDAPRVGVIQQDASPHSRNLPRRRWL